MLLTLYDQYGNEKAELQANDSSTQDKEVQGDNVLSLGFTLYEHVGIDVNDYVDFGGERYWAVEQYEPAEKSSVEWEYSLKLYGIESLIKRFLVLNNTDGENEAVFTLTARPLDHVRLIVQSINAGMGTTDFKVGSVEGTDNVVINYEGKYCDEALKELAEVVGVEWWVEGETVNLCRCEWGSPVVLGYGAGLTGLEQDQADHAKFYTRLFPIGSSRNIDREQYGSSRLQLPGGAKYVDVAGLVERYGVIHHYEQEAFSDIYPRRVGVVSSVRHEEVKGSDGKPFTIWYFKDDGLAFDPNDYEIGGLVKRVSFLEGSELAGLGTDNDHYFEVNFDSETREFEIITIWPYDDDRQLPGETLVPKVGDQYILWNIRMPDEYYTLAEAEFLSAVEAYNRKHTQDVSRYKGGTDPVWIEETGTELEIGRRVRLKSQEYFPRLGYRESRITRISRSVNLPSQMDLEISDALSSGTLEKIDDAINGVKSYAGSIMGAVNVPDVIKSWETTKPTDNNLYSARRTHLEFLSKKSADTAQKVITFLEGIKVGDGGQYYIDAEGAAALKSLLVETIEADGIKTEAIAGKSYTGAELLGDKGFAGITDSDGYGHLITDYLTVRIKGIFAALEIRKVYYSSGNILLGGAGSHIVRVVPVGFDGQTIDAYMNEDGYVHTRSEHKEYATDGSGNRLAIGGKLLARTVKTDTVTTYDSLSDFYSGEVAAWRCYALADDGTTATMNDWKVGDQAQCRTFNVDAGFHEDVSNRYYWRLVINTGRDTLEDGKLYTYVDLSNVLAIKKDSGTAFRPLYDEWLALHPDKSESDLATVFFIGYHDYASAVEGTTGHGLWPHTDSKGNETVYGNDLPSVDDDIAQIGSQLDDERRGIVEIVAVGDAPSINIYAGIGDYDLAGHLVIRQSPNGFVVNSSYFLLRSMGDPSATAPLTLYRGAYEEDGIYGHYDVVRYVGSQWLCKVPVGTTVIGVEPGSDPDIWEVFVEKGEDTGLFRVKLNMDRIVMQTRDEYATISKSDGLGLTAKLLYDGEDVTESVPADYGMYVSDGSQLAKASLPVGGTAFLIGEALRTLSSPLGMASEVTVYYAPSGRIDHDGSLSAAERIALCEDYALARRSIPVVSVDSGVKLGSYSKCAGLFDDAVDAEDDYAHGTPYDYATDTCLLLRNPVGMYETDGQRLNATYVEEGDVFLCTAYMAGSRKTETYTDMFDHIYQLRDGSWWDFGRATHSAQYAYLKELRVTFTEEWDSAARKARKLIGTSSTADVVILNTSSGRVEAPQGVTVRGIYASDGTATTAFAVDYDAVTNSVKVTLRSRNVDGGNNLDGMAFVSGYAELSLVTASGWPCSARLTVTVARLGSHEAVVEGDVWRALSEKKAVSPLTGGVTDFFTMLEQTSERLLFIQEGLRKCGISLEDGRIDLMANQVNFTTYAVNPANRKPYIKVGKGDNGAPYLIFMDADGTNELYNLGYMGLPQIVNNAVAQSWLQMELIQLSSGVALLGKDFFYEENYLPDTWYRFNDGYTLDANGNKIWAHTASGGGSMYDAKVYDSNTLGGSDGTSPTGSLIPNGYYALLTSFTTNNTPRLITKTRTYDLYRATSSKLALRTKLTIQWSYPPTTPGGLNPLESKVVTISMDPSSVYVTINNNYDETSNFQLR